MVCLVSGVVFLPAVEDPCPESLPFRCSDNSTCLPYGMNCDNVVDCKDKSDELHCGVYYGFLCVVICTTVYCMYHCVLACSVVYCVYYCVLVRSFGYLCIFLCTCKCVPVCTLVYLYVHCTFTMRLHICGRHGIIVQYSEVYLDLSKDRGKKEVTDT